MTKMQRALEHGRQRHRRDYARKVLADARRRAAAYLVIHDGFTQRELARIIGVHPSIAHDLVRVGRHLLVGQEKRGVKP